MVLNRKLNTMKNIWIAMLLLFIPALLNAQDRGNRNEEIESYKIAYLTQKLDLSSGEAKIFWPIYNDWQKELSALRSERNKNVISFRKTEEIEALSDNEIHALITNEINYKQRNLNIEKKYYNRLKSSLPLKVVGKYYRAQETFKKELLNRFGRGRNQPNKE
ncbi:hypothetical protein GCM10011387_30850 [Pedobacter quisquiliarum]|uniref:Sensor of ECF-type sigma factor n=2 Tax=Pedobacter quisquiliarum TaxID=1834438 RepID=A0A916UK26_9SPHI|nr:hypothetical protein GCM10011387_30850 [Pedobacter quisquiliarum]